MEHRNPDNHSNEKLSNEDEGIHFSADNNQTPEALNHEDGEYGPDYSFTAEMTCPYFRDVLTLTEDDKFEKSKKSVQTKGQYADYLELHKLLDCQNIKSPVHDEHLFVITHQTYELWFKQILFDLDSIMKLFMATVVDESTSLVIINRLRRISSIFKHLADQFLLLETMTPLDFLEFREYLSNGSGFQSLQFRLLENKLGLKAENRIEYNRENYANAIDKPHHKLTLNKSIQEPSLADLVIKWLERTPGLDPSEFNFIKKYEIAVNGWMDEQFKLPAMKEPDNDVRKTMMDAYFRNKASFNDIIDETKYNDSVRRGERRFSHKAFHGALMISLYRDEPRFHQPFQMLTLLMDIDSHMTKWRYNHVTMVQRMIGGKLGTGGSSGYQYLRATVSDRYKMFLDLFNMATYLIPRHLIPSLSGAMKRKLSAVISDGFANGNGDIFINKNEYA